MANKSSSDAHLPRTLNLIGYWASSTRMSPSRLCPEHTWSEVRIRNPRSTDPTDCGQRILFTLYKCEVPASGTLPLVSSIAG